MRFKVGFVMGCAMGFMAAQKASQLQQLGNGPRRARPKAAAGRGESINSEKVKAISDLARARLQDLLESPIGGVTRDRVTELIGASLGASRAIDTTARWPR